MAWLRIDRYYSSDADVEDLQGLEVAAENPEVTFQPMMCQHCNNAHLRDSASCCRYYSQF